MILFTLEGNILITSKTCMWQFKYLYSSVSLVTLYPFTISKIIPVLWIREMTISIVDFKKWIFKSIGNTTQKFLVAPATQTKHRDGIAGEPRLFALKKLHNMEPEQLVYMS